jgi:hypothetical protein
MADIETTETVQRTFQTIYAQKLWGGTPSDDFWSGPGSHNVEFVEPYVDAIRSFAEACAIKLDAVDLGCGDFNVGSKVRDLFGRYVACDIVPELIERNRQQFPGLDVEFHCLDFSTAPLPTGDVAFVRYVLQHLSNSRIVYLVPKLAAYKYLIVTEGLPRGQFTANIDKPSDEGIRIHLDSGVVLTEPPFNLSIKASTLLREYQFGERVLIKTIAYEL